MNTPELEIIGITINHPHLVPDLISIDRNVFEGEFEKACHVAIINLFKTEQEVNEYSVAQILRENKALEIDSIFENLGDAINTIGNDENYVVVKNHLLQQKGKKDLRKLLVESTWKIDNGSNPNEIADKIIASILSKPEKSGMISIKEASEI
ncbi:MAG: hypothetical protein KJ941_10120, partial [Bacteroidetes bacterium]|nr:hypothetical protein [Bacteroidota bacterium]